MTQPLSRTSTRVTWEPPMPREEAKRLPKRDRLELCKPLLRAHQMAQREFDDQNGRRRLGDEDPNHEARWNWLYAVLDRGLHSAGDLGQARQEIRCEDEYGHYWEPASGDISLIENGLAKFHAEVYYPRPIRRRKDVWVRRDNNEFVTRRGAERWIKKRKTEYEHYVLRLLREGVYDEYPYDP